jgi:DNA-binding NarL/FixJ family response regulator
MTSDRTHRVEGCAPSGHSNKQIALELGVAASTASGRIASALEKLGFGSRVDYFRHRSTRDP